MVTPTHALCIELNKVVCILCIAIFIYLLQFLVYKSNILFRSHYLVLINSLLYMVPDVHVSLC